MSTRTAARISPLDTSNGNGFCRVSRVDSVDEALTAVADYERVSVDDLEVVDQGWRRCVPCTCGMDHDYDLWPAKERARGAFYCYVVGWQ